MENRKIYFKNNVINVFERKGIQGTIVFLHGNSMSSKIWGKQFESNKFEGYGLLAIDFPGHGDSAYSTNPDQEYNVLSYAEIVCEIISRQTSENIVLVGFSLGGNVAIECLQNINNCVGCVLLGTSLVHTKEDLSQTFRTNEKIEVLFKADYSVEDLNIFLELVTGSEELPMPDFLKNDFIKTDPNCRSFLLKSIGENMFSDELGILQKQQVSIMVMVGKEDKIISSEYLHSISKKKWLEEIIEIPNAGHIAQFENAETFNTYIEAFCKSVFRV